MAAPKIAVDIRDYLVNTASISPVSIDALAPTPILQYAVVEYAGPSNVKTHGAAPNVALDQAAIQIIARAAKFETARDNIHSVVNALDGLKDTTVNGTFYNYVSNISRPRLLLRQEDGSVLFIAEFFVQSRR